MLTLDTAVCTIYLWYFVSHYWLVFMLYDCNIRNSVAFSVLAVCQVLSFVLNPIDCAILLCKMCGKNLLLIFEKTFVVTHVFGGSMLRTNCTVSCCSYPDVSCRLLWSISGLCLIRFESKYGSEKIGSVGTKSSWNLALLCGSAPWLRSVALWLCSFLAATLSVCYS